MGNFILQRLDLPPKYSIAYRSLRKKFDREYFCSYISFEIFSAIFLWKSHCAEIHFFEKKSNVEKKSVTFLYLALVHLMQRRWYPHSDKYESSVLVCPTAYYIIPKTTFQPPVQKKLFFRYSWKENQKSSQKI